MTPVAAENDPCPFKMSSAEGQFMHTEPVLLMLAGYHEASCSSFACCFRGTPYGVLTRIDKPRLLPISRVKEGTLVSPVSVDTTV